MSINKKLKELYLNLENIKSDLKFNSYMHKNKEIHELIRSNKQFQNIHKGKRCFIVGNGPSINEQNLALLENEYVFTVNQIARHKNFNELKTNYHFWADSAFFNLDKNKPEDMELLKTFKQIKTTDNSPVCFLPYFTLNFVKEFKIDKEINISYYYTQKKISDKFNGEFDFTKNGYSFNTVVQWCIAMAIYMGFSEIYMLGCDMTGIMSMIQNYLDQEDDYYSYKVNSLERKRIKKVIEETGFEKNFQGFSYMFRDYRQLNLYCERKKIKLYNCTKGGILDCLERRRYEDIVDGKT